MSDNLLKTNTYNEILKKVLRWQILKKVDETKYHHHALTGLVNTLSKIVFYSYTNKHYNSTNHIDGFHIYSKDLGLLKRNKISQKFTFFTRVERSTYHKNNSNTPESNGYSHWYAYSDLINDSIQLAIYLTIRQIKYSDRFDYYENSTIAKVKSVILTRPETGRNYIKIRKKMYSRLLKLFRKGLCDDFWQLLYHSEGSDKHYVYVRNEQISTSLNGLGREYTTLGNLSKATRHLILRGYTEIDLESAIQSVLVNLYYYNTIKIMHETTLETFKNDFPAHHKLLSDKHRFRGNVASKFKCDEKMAKQIITSISYSPKSRIIHKYCKMRKYQVKNLPYNYEFSNKQIVECKKVIEPLIKEAIKMRKVVLEKFYHQSKDSNNFKKLGGVLISEFKEMIDEDIKQHNKKLKGNGKGKSLDDRRIYRIYELVEHQIRLKMIEYINQNGIHEYHQLHDCVIFDGNIDSSSLEKYIFDELNLRVSFSQETYQNVPALVNHSWYYDDRKAA